MLKKFYILYTAVVGIACLMRFHYTNSEIGQKHDFKKVLPIKIGFLTQIRFINRMMLVWPLLTQILFTLVWYIFANSAPRFLMKAIAKTESNVIKMFIRWLTSYLLFLIFYHGFIYA